LYVSVVFHFECKSNIKKRSHQKSDFAGFRKTEFF
jgi:hypothetical protein